MSKFAAQKAKYWGAPVPEGLKHGTNTYAKGVYGCDCSVCLPSGRRIRPKGQGTPGVERNRALRRRKRGKPVPPGTKHGVYTYKTYGCPCDVCVTANRQQREQQRWAWLATARGRYDYGGDTRFGKTVICWPPRDAGSDWRCPECGR